MNENLKRAIDSIAAGMNQDEARNVIHSELSQIVASALEAKKQSLAKAIFNGTVGNDDNEAN